MLGDGAMGTQLMLAGLEQGNCGEAWNLTHPERVLAIQRRYAEAGSECIITNTFGGSRIMLNRHSEADHVVEINKAGVEIARQAFGEQGRIRARRHRSVRRLAGAIRRFHRGAGAKRLRGAGRRRWSMAEPDAIIIETQTSLEELLIGIEAAQTGGRAVHHRLHGLRRYSRRLDLPHHDGHRSRARRRIHGGARRAHRRAELRHRNGHGARAQAVERYKSVTSLPVMVQPNAGKPKLVNMKVVYDETPEQMVKGLVPLLEAGANIVGACCGSTPDHIRAFRKAMDEFLESKGIELDRSPT